MIIQAIPLSELVQLAAHLHHMANEHAGRAIVVMSDMQFIRHNTGDDLIATGYSASAGAYEQCARKLDALIAEWNVPPTFIPEVEL